MWLPVSTAVGEHEDQPPSASTASALGDWEVVGFVETREQRPLVKEEVLLLSSCLVLVQFGLGPPDHSFSKRSHKSFFR